MAADPPGRAPPSPASPDPASPAIASQAHASPTPASPAPGAQRAATAESSLKRLADLIESRRGADPGTSYVARLLGKGEDAVLKKIGEEATETVMAAKDGDARRIVAETADLWFHTLVMLAHYGLRPEHVIAELERREGLSGLDEKAQRQNRD